MAVVIIKVREKSLSSHVFPMFYKYFNTLILVLEVFKCIGLLK